MISVSPFTQKQLPDLVEQLEERGFTLAKDMRSDIVVIKHFEVGIYRKVKTIIVLCKNTEEAAKAERQNCIPFQYTWELLRYLEAPNSAYTGTYIINGFVVPRIGLYSCMKGWKQLSTPTENITYFHQDPIDNCREKAYYDIPCYVKNALLDVVLDKVCDKSQLYLNMKRYIPETKPLDNFEFENGVYIAKPAGKNAFSGKGITIITRKADVDKAKKIIHANPNWKGIVSKYVDDPLLFRGKKFHVRVYMLVTSANSYSICPRSHIFTAKLTHQKGKYESIYTDSHGATTPEDWETEKDFDSDLAATLRAKIELVCSEIWSVIGGQIESYPESKYGYEVISPDIMFDSDLNPWLLEVNRKVGLKSSSKTPEKYADFVFEFWRWIFASGVEPLLALRDVK